MWCKYWWLCFDWKKTKNQAFIAVVCIPVNESCAKLIPNNNNINSNEMRIKPKNEKENKINKKTSGHRPENLK